MKTRSDIFNIVNTFRAKIISLNSDSVIIEITGVKEKNIAFLEVLKPFEIIEIVRTGSIAMMRDANITQDQQKGV